MNLRQANRPRGHFEVGHFLPFCSQNDVLLQRLTTTVEKMAETVAPQTPPVLKGHVPSEKEKKYDRQLRLWAASGQAALESANILLFNTGSGAVGVEALKNLVLPGKVVPEQPPTESTLNHLFSPQGSANLQLLTMPRCKRLT